MAVENARLNDPHRKRVGDHRNGSAYYVIFTFNTYEICTGQYGRDTLSTCPAKFTIFIYHFLRLKCVKGRREYAYVLKFFALSGHGRF